MKTYFNTFRILLFITLFGLSIGYSQERMNSNDDKVLDSLVIQMFTNMNNKDYDAILDSTHPKVFELIPKESMKDVLKSMFEGNEDLIIELPKLNPEYKLTQIYKGENNLEYAFVSYDLNTKMTFPNQEFDDETKQIMFSSMKAKGFDIEFTSNNSMDVLIKNSMTIIIRENATNYKWAMVNYNPDSPLFYQILPSEVMEKAREHKQNLMLESKKKTEKAD